MRRQLSEIRFSLRRATTRVVASTTLRKSGRVGLILFALWVGLEIAIPKPSLLGGARSGQAVYDQKGRLLRLSLAPDERYRLNVPLGRISPQMIEATLLQEDRYFYWHPGVNPAALFRAIWHTYVKRDRRVGASTISMQLARMRFRIYSRNLSGKFIQIMRAIQIEWHYSKDEILEAYLSLVPYGGNVEGVGAASLIYFNKNANELTLPEALTLAVVPQDPVQRHPGRERAELVAARQSLYAEWLEIHPDAKRDASLLQLSLAAGSKRELPFHAPHFVNTLMQENPGRYELESTLDLEMQRLLERQIKAYVDRRQRDGIHNAAAMLVDTRGMQIRALVGSANFFDASIHGQVNGTGARRSPGSTLKPFIYGLAIDQGLIHPMSMLKDAPTRVGAYNPENFDREFVGPVHAYDALVKSRNVPALVLASKLNSPTLYEFLGQAQVEGLLDEDHYGLALVLGGAEMRMTELVSLYGMLANNGVWQPLSHLRDDSPGKMIPLLSPEAAFLTLDMLGQNPRPRQSYRSDWVKNPLPIHWKTGTSWGFRDAWSIGVFSHYVLAVWVGNFQGQGHPAFVGRRAAGPLFFEIVDAIRGSHRSPLFPTYLRPPAGVDKIQVCAISGAIPGPHCHHRVESWFIPGRSPIKLCTIHRQVLVDRTNGQRVCRAGPATEARVYEFWPSDLQALFRKAGIPRKLAPPANPECVFNVVQADGTAPEITSPSNGLVYQIRAHQPMEEKVPLTAVVDGDSRELFWFADDRFLGRVDANQPFFWPAKSGQYIIRAVDDRGRSDSVQLNIVQNR